MDKNNKEMFDFYVKNGIFKQEQDIERLEYLVNRLLENLYKPIIPKSSKSSTFVTDRAKLKKYGLDGEPANWGGGLSATVEKKRGCYFVVIEEASPNDCPMLCEYIEKYLSSWGNLTVNKNLHKVI